MLGIQLFDFFLNSFPVAPIDELLLITARNDVYSVKVTKRVTHKSLRKIAHVIASFHLANDKAMLSVFQLMH